VKEKARTEERKLWDSKGRKEGVRIFKGVAGENGLRCVCQGSEKKEGKKLEKFKNEGTLRTSVEGLEAKSRGGWEEKD